MNIVSTYIVKNLVYKCNDGNNSGSNDGNDGDIVWCEGVVVCGSNILIRTTLHSTLCQSLYYQIVLFLT